MRYFNQNIYVNNDPAYQRYLKKRGMKLIRQFDTPQFRHPSAADRSHFKRAQHVWGTGDRFYKLADDYYQDPEKWWVIALYNQKPTEFHVQPGQVIYIPYPLDSVLYYMGY
jgi:nucleoid-associated protein YgaU